MSLIIYKIFVLFQNQNEDSGTGRSTSMTWFSSLTRRGVKITSPKKRSFDTTLSPRRGTPSRLNK